jgi:endonuclease YncB( thermonuclease family)
LQLRIRTTDKAYSSSFPAATPNLTQVITGKVVIIADGDTITILDNTKAQHKIRLYGIDSPEKVQVFGNSAKK